MYQQVYMHRVTRGFEILLHNLFSAAAHCAKTNNGLPPGTPLLVETYFQNNGQINLKDFLQFDESQIISACHVWAKTEKPKYSTIRRLSTAFLNRERIYAAVDLDGTPGTMIKLLRAVESLPKEEDGATPIYGIDTIEDTPYKGMLYRAREHATLEEIVNESILLADPDNADSAEPVETNSRMLQEMDAEQFEVTRLYFDRKKYKNIAPIAKELNITLPNVEV